jgi:hypothetical protein
MEVRVSLENVVTRELRRGDRLDLLATRRRSSSPRLVASDVYMVGFVDPNMLLGQGQEQQRSGNGGDSRNGNGNGRQQQPGLIESLIQSTTQPRGAGRPVMTRSTNLLVALNPKDVVPLAQAQAGGAALAVVLHGQKEVKDGQLLTVQGHSWDVEYIAGADRGTLEFVQ